LLTALDSTSGLLPLGRHPASLDDLQARFVDDPAFAASATRSEIWGHFRSATGEFQRVVPTVCLWLGGSFFTSKMDPDDIDIVYWCEDRHVNAVSDPRDKMILQMFATNQVRPQTGLRVDTRYCLWHVRPEAGVQNTIEHQEYVLLRGFWDDFWQRKRSGAKNDPPVRADALPKRGYYEVMLDGFDVV